jgi:glycosyltransferase involved in cell wall biosynthesis
MFPFAGEAEAIKQGLVDRVLFVSDFQAQAFRHFCTGTTTFITGNFIDDDEYAYRKRTNTIFTIGRLSRPDPSKYPLNFPVFYEELGLKDVRYRVMSWGPELQKQFKWHRFGLEWDLLSTNKESAAAFLQTLDLFVYPLGHRIKESWGRAVVEAMLTGAVVVVPAGHNFDKMLVNGESGFICKEFKEFKTVVHQLYEDYQLRERIARQGAQHARDSLCNSGEHQKRWIEALSF